MFWNACLLTGSGKYYTLDGYRLAFSYLNVPFVFLSSGFGELDYSIILGLIQN